MTTTCKRRKVDRSNEDPILHEDPILCPNQKIFLSHSGAQKEFVEQLCVDLERRLRFPFFDKRPSSLPKGERFPSLIKDAVKQCEMMVVVVSDEYFTSKWPMIELHAFMQATLENRKLKILPLFFGLDVTEFSETERQKRWFEVWEGLATADVQARINVKEWKQSLDLIEPFNGIVYNHESKGVVAYRQEIVSNICKAIPADVKFDESHVQGRSKLCKVVRQHLQYIPDSTKMSSVRVIGLYGVGGIGKTQLCKIMCNELDGEFDGKVCHVELCKGSDDHAVVKKVLVALTNASVEVVEEVEEGKCKDILLDKGNWKQKTFLSIDNVWDDYKSLEQAKLVLKAPFVKGSWVIVTSRLKKTLKGLDIDENACFEMPELGEDDAKSLFLYYAMNGKKFESIEDADAIEECIRSCYFWKGKSQESHYHPLSLKALGIHLHYHGGERPSIWMKNFAKLKESSYLRDPVNPLFIILRSNFDGLPQWEQDLFMDVSLFFPREANLMEWLCIVHNEEEDVIQDWLQHLVDKGLLEDVDLGCGGGNMHDLYREFAILESKGKLAPLNMEKRRWIYLKDALPKELEDEPRSCRKRLTRLCLSMSDGLREPILNLGRIDWKYYTQLVTLELDICCKTCAVLKLKGLVRLRSLILHSAYLSEIMESDYSTPSSEDFDRVFGYKPTKVGQLPASLKFLKVKGLLRYCEIFLHRDVLALCANLVTLDLWDVSASCLDLRNCKSLQKVVLQRVSRLKVLQGFAVELGASLESLSIEECPALIKIDGLDSLVGLQSLALIGNMNLSKLCDLSSLKHLRTLRCSELKMDEVPGLDGLVGLKSLTLMNSDQMSKLPSLTGLQCLCGLTICGLGISEMPNLNGLDQLKYILAFDNQFLTSLQGLGDLPALNQLDLGLNPLWCGQLDLRLPSSMSKLTNLKKLDLCNRRVELHEEDIHMLQGLQLLEPVLVTHPFAFYRPLYRLDFRRQKILSYSSNTYIPNTCNVYEILTMSGWEEKDLHFPPTGHLVGEGLKIQDVEKIWNLALEPATTIIGTETWET